MNILRRGLAASLALLACVWPAAAQQFVTPPIQTTNTIPINISTATTTQLIAASGSKVIYIMHWDLLGGGTGNFTLEYGTGVNCATNPQPLTGPYPLVAQTRLDNGAGLGPVLIVPLTAALAGQALCAVTSAAVQMSGSVAFAQF
jgi:hypothetical protein